MKKPCSDDLALLPITDAEIKTFVWGPPGRQRLFNAVATVGKIAGPAGIIHMGLLVASGYAQTGRLDLLAGGALMTLMGAGILDIGLGKNYLSRAFSKAASFIARKRIAISQGFVLAASGLAACAALGGGEMYNYLSSHGIDLSELLTSQAEWARFAASASYSKIAANVAPFLAASALDIKSVRERATAMMDLPVSILQNFLGLAGTFMIAKFAHQAGLPVFETAAGLQILTTMAAIGTDAYNSFSPRFFLSNMPMNDEMMFLARVYADGKQDVLNQEREAMMTARGHMTPRLRKRMERSRAMLESLAPPAV